MLRPIALLLAGLSLIVGCTEGAAPPGTGAAGRTDAPAPTKTGEPVTTKPDPSPIPYAPRSELPKIEIVGAPAACPELPALGARASEAQRRLAPYAAVIRRLACEPELYGLPTLQLAAELGLPPGAELGFSGPRATTLTLPEGVTAGDMAAVFGFKTPQVRVTWQAYHALTHLGTNPTSGAFDLFAPGRVHVGVAYEVDRYGKDAGVERVAALADDAAIHGTVHVSMSESTLTIVADDDAVPLVVSALAQLAARPELLAQEPAEAAPQIGLGGERYRVARVSLHAGEKTAVGLSIDPRRTILPAKALASALGLPDAVAANVNREHDVWELEAAGTTEVIWRGLELSVRVDVADGDARTVPLDGAEVAFISILPAG